jgi:hypothetical protein
MEPAPVGIAWYRREDFARLRAMYVDADEVPETYEAWLDKAMKFMGQMTLEGFYMVKVYLDPEAFAAWCESHGLEMDGKARAEYARDRLSRMPLPKRSATLAKRIVPLNDTAVLRTDRQRTGIPRRQAKR